jgi:hypothetical protein
MLARWIRWRGSAGGAEPAEALEFDEMCTRLAVAQSLQAAPILLWGEAAARYLFALIAPLRLAPGRRRRWPAWGLAPAVAAYRQFGVPVYLNDDDLWLHGRRISRSVVETLGECAVVRSSFLMQFPAACAATPSSALEQAFRLRLEAQHGWQFEHSWPSGAEMPACAVA